VVVADVVGYSRLMERDEAGTHQRLRALRAELIDPKISAHGGRIVDTAGDGMLLEFPSATSALRCAIEVQRKMAKRNQDVAADDRIDFRIGVTVGDVIVEGDDIIGDGVNVAARLEALAAPGGICVSDAVREHVREDLGVRYTDARGQRVKNIFRPIHVHRVLLGDGLDREPRAGEPWQQDLRGGRPPSRRIVIATGALLSVAVALFVAWRFALPGTAPDAAASGAQLRSVLVAPFGATDPALNALAARPSSDVARGLGDSARTWARVVSPETAAALAPRTTGAQALGRAANVRFVIAGDLRPEGSGFAVTLRMLMSAKAGRSATCARPTSTRRKTARMRSAASSRRWRA